MVGKELYIGIRSHKDIVKELREGKKNIYLMLYKVLEEIKAHDLRINKLKEMENKVLEMKGIVSELLKEMPEIEDVENILSDISEEEKEEEEYYIEVIKKEEKKSKKAKKESKEDNKNVKEELDEISRELAELKEELKKLLEYY
jgi:chromosome segregation ATPase